MFGGKLNQRKTEFFVNRGNTRPKSILKVWVGVKILIILMILLLLGACVNVSKTPSDSKIKNVEVSEKPSRYSTAQSIDKTFEALKDSLVIPVLKPSYLPRGYFVTSDFDVHENGGQNPRIISDKEAAVELERAAPSATSEYGHQWLRFTYGSSMDIANYSTPGLYVDDSPAMYVGGKSKSWAIITWAKRWKGQNIRYALEGSGISDNELIRIAKSMKTF